LAQAPKLLKVYAKTNKTFNIQRFCNKNNNLINKAPYGYNFTGAGGMADRLCYNT